MFDPSFNLRIKQWHSVCDKHISSSMTIPIEPTITTTYDFGACGRLEQSCLSADYETNLCSNKYLPTSSLSYASCVCQPPIYSLFSECQYNGNISCKQATGIESNIIGYSVCSYFWSGSVISTFEKAFKDLTDGQSAGNPLTYRSHIFLAHYWTDGE